MLCKLSSDRILAGGWQSKILSQSVPIKVNLSYKGHLLEINITVPRAIHVYGELETVAGVLLFSVSAHHSSAVLCSNPRFVWRSLFQPTKQVRSG